MHSAETDVGKLAYHEASPHELLRGERAVVFLPDLPADLLEELGGKGHPKSVGVPLTICKTTRQDRGAL